MNRHPKVTYHACDIANADAVARLLKETKPRIIFHTASPRHADFSVDQRDFYATNVRGTKNLLNNATAAPSVRALVFTSSVSVMAGNEHLLLDESSPLWQASSGATPYELTKSLADVLVREANSEKLRTVSLRHCLVVGERDHSYVPLWMNAPTNMQIGNNENLIDAMYVGNSVAAHLLAAKALLDPRCANGKVDGEAFNITDGRQIRFWDLSRLIWSAAGSITPIKKVTVIPAWLALIMAEIAEWAFWIFTLGTRKPKDLNKLVVLYCTKSHTYNIKKAKEVLGYSPVPNMLEHGVKTSVDYELRKRAANQGRKDK